MKLRCGKGIECPEDFSFLYKKKYVTRAGIVPYIIDRLDDTYILLGVDKPSGVYADLGGTREKGETTLDVAIREFLEESRSVLSVDLKKTTTIMISDVTPKRLRSKKIRKQVILFPRIELNQDNIDIDKKFQSTVPKNKYEDEMSRLEWVKLDEFLTIPNYQLSRSLKEVKKILQKM